MDTDAEFPAKVTVHLIERADGDIRQAIENEIEKAHKMAGIKTLHPRPDDVVFSFPENIKARYPFKVKDDATAF